MQTERRVAANPQTKPTDLGCESAERLAATIRRHHRHLFIMSGKDIVPVLTCRWNNVLNETEILRPFCHFCAK